MFQPLPMFRLLLRAEMFLDSFSIFPYGSLLFMQLRYTLPVFFLSLVNVYVARIRCRVGS